MMMQMDNEILQHLSYRYAKQVVNNEIITPKYVKIQCQEFIYICEDKDSKYCINRKKLRKIDGLLKLMVMPTGDRQGQLIYNALAGYQMLFIVAMFCVVERDNCKSRRYKKGLLEVARRQGKTLVIGVMFIIMLLTSPRYSMMYSIAPVKRQSEAVMDTIKCILNSSPALINYFKIRRNYIECTINNNQYRYLTELNNEGKFDSMTISMFLADEVGNLKSIQTLEALKSGTLTVDDNLQIFISTKYPNTSNPFEKELEYFKKILDKEISNEECFALIYEPDCVDNWEQDDNIILQANPLAEELNNIFERLQKQRNEAIEREELKENFLTKHCNIIYQTKAVENYIDMDNLLQCCSNNINWENKEIYVGLDLSMTTDNTAVAMVARDGKNIIADVMFFIPFDKIKQKNRNEKINYNDFIKNGKCIACNGGVIDYTAVEDYILSISQLTGGKIKQVGYDRWNCIATAQRLEEKGLETVEVKQHSTILHAPIKWLEELIVNKKFQYSGNELLEINFKNAKCKYDTNLNRYLSKKDSRGKIDGVMAILNALYLLQQAELGKPKEMFMFGINK